MIMEKKKLTQVELNAVVADHGKWLQSDGTEGKRADLSNTDLSGLSLIDAIMRGTFMVDAIMTGAILPTGETWEDYLKISIPKLLTCTGKTIKEIVKAGCWNCHSWTNCPMAYVFGVESLRGIPAEYKKQVEQFVVLFDTGLLHEPTCE